MNKPKVSFQKTEVYNPKDKKEKRLIKAFTFLNKEEEIAAFLRDLLTIAEIEEFANRLEIVRLLTKGHAYQKIAKETKTSTTTVTRVAHWYNRGCGGYRMIIDKLSDRLV